ncbi:gonadotropin-releasing hormone receptor [Folsomia candida]|uniref:Gonadotropin-releasing hormone receptor n=1 Tax=Folsomia candida TaxID=158441 RepID=A0A226EC71_FOLCA|nr:gonadotropin-releasing hormone receptor [Folsomia candida]OXA54704.1 Gonadotropin-releasing hormone receptor [Folsomia candida]
MPHSKYSAIVGTSVFQDGGEPFRNYRGFELPDNTTTLREPTSFRELSQLSLNFVLIYSFLFVISATLNVSELISVIRYDKRHRRSRIAHLYRHLCIADLLVTFTCMLMEILWRVTIQWYGGNLLCKGCQFLQAFSQYLSSLVVTGITVDKYFAIVYPFKLARAEERAKLMGGIAWVAATVCALPQIAIYNVAPHPNFPNFQQCVAASFVLRNKAQELTYSIFSLSVVYFLPVTVITFTYGSILCKIFDAKESTHQPDIELSVDEHRSATFSHQEENSIPDHNTAKIDGDFPLDKITSKSNSIITNAEALKPEIVSRGEPISPLGIRPHGLKLDAKLDQSRLISVEPVSPQGSDRGRPPPFLRRNQAGGRLLARAKVKTLRTTFIILATFLLCWTPYVVMTSWYMVNRASALSSAPRWVQDGLFVLAMMNSAINPLIYGSFGDRRLSTSGCFSKYVAIMCGRGES